MISNLSGKCSFLIMLFTVLAFSVSAQQDGARVTLGPFKSIEESLKQYQYPEWFRDAKFGIWAHWGPQAVPRQGDWYARWMYQEKDPAY